MRWKGFIYLNINRKSKKVKFAVLIWELFMPYISGNLFFYAQKLIMESRLLPADQTIGTYVGVLINMIAFSFIVMISDIMAYQFISGKNRTAILFLLLIYILHIVSWILIFVMTNVPLFLTNVFMSDYMHIFVIHIMTMLYLCIKGILK